MDVCSLNDFTRGWFIGNFSPSVLKTANFEVGVLHHSAGEYWAPHYHAVATEYNLLLEGKMTINGSVINPGDIFILKPMEVAVPIFLSDCKVLCIKTPSIPGDKYNVD